MPLADDYDLLCLNHDCISMIFSFVPITEQFKFTLISNNFNEFIAKNLQLLPLKTSSLRQNYNLKQLETIFSQLGCFVKYLVFDEWINASNIAFYSLIPNYCDNVVNVDFFYPSSHAISCYEDLLSKNVQNIKAITVRRFTRECDISDLQKYEMKLITGIFHLKSLQSLHLEALNEVTGENFHLLENLLHLNVEFCSNYEPQYFTLLCKSSVQLLSLNINGFFVGFDEAIEHLVDEQKNIEDLTISNAMKGFEKTAKIKKLKQITLWDMVVGESPKTFVEVLVKHHKHDLTAFRVAVDCPRNLLEYDADVLLFENLKELYFPDYKYLEDRYLANLIKNLPQLEKLRIYYHPNGSVTHEGIYAICTKLVLLKEFILFPMYAFNLEFMTQISSARKVMHLGLLIIYMNTDDKLNLPFMQLDEIIQTEDYRVGASVLRLSSLLRRHLDMLPW